MTEIEAAWLAGFLDGEGSFMVTRSQHKDCVAPTYDAVIGAGNTDKRLVDRCMALAGGKIVPSKAKNPRHKDAYVWALHGTGVGPLIERILPYLTAKRDQAETVLQLRRITKKGSPAGRFGTRKTPEEVAERCALYEKCRLLNRRGVPA